MSSPTARPPLDLPLRNQSVNNQRSAVEAYQSLGSDQATPKKELAQATPISPTAAVVGEHSTGEHSIGECSTSSSCHRESPITEPYQPYHSHPRLNFHGDSLTLSPPKTLLSPLGHLRRASQSSSHSHTLRHSHLEAIESSGSESSAVGSPITSHAPSPLSASLSYQSFPHLHHPYSQIKSRDRFHDHPTEHLLTLAARNAQKQLREHGLAVFPNDDRHIPVSHYLDQSHTPQFPSVAPSSQASEYDYNPHLHLSEIWETKDTREHHACLELERKHRGRLYDSLDSSPTRLPSNLDGTMSMSMSTMERCRRQNLSPAPMLGEDIVFPRCASPEFARFDVTQGAEYLKNKMKQQSLYKNARKANKAVKQEIVGLWGGAYSKNHFEFPRGNKFEASSQTERKFEASSSKTVVNGLWGGSYSTAHFEAIPKKQPLAVAVKKESTTNGGLWGGSCVSKASPPGGCNVLEKNRLPTPVSNSWLWQASYKQDLPISHFPPSPPHSQDEIEPMINLVEEKAGEGEKKAGKEAEYENDTEKEIEKEEGKLERTEEMEGIVSGTNEDSRQEVPSEEEESANLDEFSDDFVTQVYNYLSFGCPTIAHDYDEELSKISHISVEELRVDDIIAEEAGGKRGYIRLGEEGFDGGVKHTACARWRALRCYIDEWKSNHAITTTTTTEPVESK